jgi:hypothetical protein
METRCVFFEVGTEFLNIIEVNLLWGMNADLNNILEARYRTRICCFSIRQQTFLEWLQWILLKTVPIVALHYEQ